MDFDLQIYWLQKKCQFPSGTEIGKCSLCRVFAVAHDLLTLYFFIKTHNAYHNLLEEKKSQELSVLGQMTRVYRKLNKTHRSIWGVKLNLVEFNEDICFTCKLRGPFVILHDPQLSSALKDGDVMLQSPHHPSDFALRACFLFLRKGRALLETQCLANW